MHTGHPGAKNAITTICPRWSLNVNSPDPFAATGSVKSGAVSPTIPP